MSHDAGGGDERRRTSRVPLAIAVDVRAAAAMWNGDTRDLSLRGAFVHGVTAPAPGSPVRLTLTLSDHVRIEVDATVVRSCAEGIGVYFEGVDLEGFQHLRHLLLFNAAEPERVREEIARHRGIRSRDEARALS
ncbi:MAG: hypothetical protein CSA66_06060 [Proteobacteria bacterium]|nr:MAG: hypothetical protein CSA66_06060 [Pseudomonadota bacterium]